MINMKKIVLVLLKMLPRIRVLMVNQVENFAPIKIPDGLFNVFDKISIENNVVLRKLDLIIGFEWQHASVTVHHCTVRVVV